MIRLEQAKSAAGDVSAAALLGQGWEDALQRVAEAADAGGASLVRVRAGRLSAQLSSAGWAEAEAEIVAGQAPPSPLMLYPDHALGSGFRVDHEVWPHDAMRRDPYYQEFLRPRGVFFHAKLRLCSEPGEWLTLTLKRRVKFGPYEPADIAVLDAVAPDLRAAFRTAQRVLDAEAAGLAGALHQRGAPVFELDSSGHVLRMHGGGTDDCGLLVRNRRLSTAERLSQDALDRAVAAAVRPPQRPAAAPLSDRDGGRQYLHCIPIVGRARDVFQAAAAVAVLIPARPSPIRRRLDPAPLREAFGLTDREAELTALVGEGLELTEIARRLKINPGTARNHLKSVFAKTETHRQGELVALLSRFGY